MRSEARVAHKAVRATARILLVVLVMTFLVIAVGEGLPARAAMTPSVVLQSIGMLAILIGLVAGWRWELVGGITVLTGTVLFCGVEWYVNGGLPRGFVFPLVALTAILLLVAGWWHRTHLAATKAHLRH